MRPSYTDPVGRTITAFGVLLVAVAGCASGGATAPSTTHQTRTPRAAAPSTAPPTTTATSLPTAFVGSVAAFYDAPHPLPKARPGTLIRYQPIRETAVEATWRIMYHSIDAAGRDQPTTGTVTFPRAEAPAGGWPVVSDAPGTVGLNPGCALSRRYDRPDSFGVEGVSVRTDYIGMVDGQRQRYLSGPSEAHSVIDAVRAVRNIPAAHAGKRWVAFGHSQGGHAALFTNQLAAAYAPELDLEGTVVGAPASQLTELHGPDDRIIPHLVELLALFGIAADHPGTDPASYLTARAREHVDVLEHGCMPEVITTFAGMADHGLFARDPLTTEPAATLLRANDPGKVHAASPILLFEGTDDADVVPARAEAARARLCRVGQVTQYLLLPGANHGTEIDRARGEISSWIADRLAGRPAPDNCPTT
jgi:alpha-beta hydrolase superfamily lysophospholipase